MRAPKQLLSRQTRSQGMGQKTPSWVLWAARLAATSASLFSAPLFIGGGYAGAHEAFCAKNSGAAAVDLSQPVDAAFLDKMHEVGVSTIIRYYDHINEDFRGKTIHRSEADLIRAAGFKIAVVFQHRNSRFSSFTPQRGRADALRSLDLADEIGQPKGTMIYFGVDGHWGSPAQLSAIRAYFVAARAVLIPQNYRVSAYGSGLVCETLVGEGLADMCWLSNAKGWPGYKDYYAAKQWRLVQSRTETCGGRLVDFNRANPAFPKFGQF